MKTILAVILLSISFTASAAEPKMPETVGEWMEALGEMVQIISGTLPPKQMSYDEQWAEINRRAEARVKMIELDIKAKDMFK